MIDIDPILAPFPGENPAGEELRYKPVYDEIREARRADDALDRGDWQHELKVSDWDRVIKLSVQALTEKSKDLQIAAWLAEALVRTEGVDGLIAGFQIMSGLLTRFWEGLYPGIEDGDLDFRAAPLEFANSTLGFMIRAIPLTDPGATSGYSWIKWQESRSVGYEEHTKDSGARQEMIADGKISAEVFDSAVARSSKEFYAGLAERIGEARALFASLDAVVDEKFGGDAPLISEIDKALADCERLVSGILKEKRAAEPDEPDEAPPGAAAEAPGEEAGLSG
uniref:type VI secretion system protein TssA n=1 Tax=Desulfococcus sp. TaxID=2025834 RepID=UPI0035944FB0